MLVARCLSDGLRLGCVLGPLVWQHVLGRRSTYADLRDAEPGLAAHLGWLVAHNTSALPVLLSFQVAEGGSRGSAVELCPHGATMEVTEANKAEFVGLVVQHVVRSRWGSQLEVSRQRTGGREGAWRGGCSLTMLLNV